MKLIVPCVDCDAESARLRKQGFVVSACKPISTRPGMCELEFDVPQAVAMPAGGGGAHLMAAAPGPAVVPVENFTGRGNPLTQGGLDHAASGLGVNLPALWSVMTVETRGCGFLPDRRPQILFERHVFHKETKGKFDKTAPDLSNAVAGGYGSGGASQYGRLERAVALDRQAALNSTSWGLGQIMGFNATSAGFADVETMVAAMAQTEDAQLLGLVNFVAKKGLAKYLKNEDWAGFAAGYNGAGYKNRGYDEKLKLAFTRFSVGPLPNLEVRMAQLLLTYQGYKPGSVDGWFGDNTQKAVIRFQKANALPVSGKLDDATLVALSATNPGQG